MDALDACASLMTVVPYTLELSCVSTLRNRLLGQRCQGGWGWRTRDLARWHRGPSAFCAAHRRVGHHSPPRQKKQRHVNSERKLKLADVILHWLATQGDTDTDGRTTAGPGRDQNRHLQGPGRPPGDQPQKPPRWTQSTKGRCMKPSLENGSLFPKHWFIL